MKYTELLNQLFWFEKCAEILHRDQYRCQKCGALGYHNNAYYECQSAEELDNLLKGFLIEDSLPSAFMDRIKGHERLQDFFILHKKDSEESDIQYVGNKYLVDLTISMDKLGRISWKILTASKMRIQAATCKGSLLPIDKNSVKIPLDTNLQYSTGRYFVFDKSYFDNYIVRIEKRWPTGASGDDHGVVFWGCIFISICYQDCCISLEFLDNTKVDNEGNYLDVPIVPKVLNVHHKYYINGKNPWEYGNGALVTLCQDCHCDVHKSTSTPVYKDLGNKQVLWYAHICERCGGSGYLPQYHHVKGGICFKCHGEGVIIDLDDQEGHICDYSESPNS